MWHRILRYLIDGSKMISFHLLGLLVYVAMFRCHCLAFLRSRNVSALRFLDNDRYVFSDEISVLPAESLLSCLATCSSNMHMTCATASFNENTTRCILYARIYPDPSVVSFVSAVEEDGWAAYRSKKFWFILKQNRSTEGCSKLKRSVDMTSSGKNGLNIRTNASPKWDRTRCPEE